MKDLITLPAATKQKQMLKMNGDQECRARDCRWKSLKVAGSSGRILYYTGNRKGEGDKMTAILDLVTRGYHGHRLFNNILCLPFSLLLSRYPVPLFLREFPRPRKNIKAPILEGLVNSGARPVGSEKNNIYSLLGFHSNKENIFPSILGCHSLSFF